MRKFFAPFFLLAFSTSCFTDHSDSTKLNSREYDSKTERIAQLKSHITSFSEFQDAEFELFNVNGFDNQRLSVPGASSWDYKFVVKVETDSIPKWTAGMTEIECQEQEMDWTKELIQHRKQNWVTHSKPKCFVRSGENVTLFVFRKEGIVFKRVTNL
jgi:hypothetical protein